MDNEALNSVSYIDQLCFRNHLGEPLAKVFLFPNSYTQFNPFVPFTGQEGSSRVTALEG
jgi:hypothetical protein